MSIFLILFHLNTGMTTEITQPSLDYCNTSAQSFVELGYGTAKCEVR